MYTRERGKRDRMAISANPHAIQCSTLTCAFSHGFRQPAYSDGSCYSDGTVSPGSDTIDAS